MSFLKCLRKGGGVKRKVKKEGFMKIGRMFLKGGYVFIGGIFICFNCLLTDLWPTFGHWREGPLNSNLDYCIYSIFWPEVIDLWPTFGHWREGPLNSSLDHCIYSIFWPKVTDSLLARLGP